MGTEVPLRTGSPCCDDDRWCARSRRGLPRSRFPWRPFPTPPITHAWPLDPPAREDGALVWTGVEVDPVGLQKRGWRVHSFREIRERYIAPARARGAARVTLDNPAKPLLDLLDNAAPLAIVGISIRTAADLRDLYGFLIEPAYRRGLSLLVSSDRDLDDLQPDAFVDPIGFPWTLERLRHLAARYRLGPMPDGLPPMTPIERTLCEAMRARGLQPIAQYGIDRYRADFAFTDARVVVECDGKPWHDPDRDRRRDAVLRNRGWEPVHFSGSEIHRDAAGCALRVQRCVIERLRLAESEQPEVAFSVRPSLWRRLIAWLRGLVRRPTAVGGDASTQVGAPEVPAATAWTDGLDDQQRAAVRGRDGVVQVIAPAGSGKTKVLVARVRELLARGVPPNRILCCTFNTAAAEELQTRMSAAGVEGVEATTFHAIGRRVLKEADMLRGSVATMPYGWWRRLAKQAMDATDEGVWIDAPAAREQNTRSPMVPCHSIGTGSDARLTWCCEGSSPGSGS